MQPGSLTSTGQLWLQQRKLSLNTLSPVKLYSGMPTLEEHWFFGSKIRLFSRIQSNCGETIQLRSGGHCSELSPGPC